MSVLQNKIDFVVLFSAEKANVNGDPLNGNRPRTDYEGYGEMSDVCVKRKIRNRMQDMGEPVFVQMAEKATDGFDSLSDRAVKCIGNVKDKDEYAAKACEFWLDVRSFGQVFAFKSAGDASCGVRGPVSVHQAVSASPVEVRSIQITKSVNGEPAKRAAAPPTQWVRSILFSSGCIRSKVRSMCSSRRKQASLMMMRRYSRSASELCL